MWYLLTDVWWTYHLLFVIFSALGVWQTPFFAYHMLDLVLRNHQVQYVIKAVTTNGKSVLLIASLGICVVYFFSAFGFFFLRFLYDDSSAGYLYCDTWFHCLLTTFWWGVSQGGGIGDLSGIPLYNNNRYWGYIFFSFLYFAIVNILFLNMVFGIILNTFGQLRDAQDDIDEDISTLCTICSISADIFQKTSPYGFEHHLNEEHPLWNYLYYLIYLSKKDKDEYTAAEEFVWNCKDEGETNFFPINRAISVKDQEEKEEEEEE